MCTPSKELIAIMHEIAKQVVIHKFGGQTEHWFKSDCGLCWNVWRCADCIHSEFEPYDMVDEFMGLLADEFESSDYPFDSSIESYDACEDKYTNPRRLAGLRRFLWKHKGN